MTRSSDAPSNDVHGNNPASNSHQENIPSGSSEKDIQASQNNLDKTTQAIQHSTNSEPINVPSGDEISLDQLHKNIPDNMKAVVNRLSMAENGDGFCLGGTASKVLADNSSMNLTVKETDSYKQLFSSCHSIVDEETGMRSILAGDTFASSDVLTDGNQKVVDISVIWSHNCDANNVVKVADAKLIHVGITKIVSDGDNEVMKVFGGYVDMSGKIVALDNEDGTDVLTTAEEIAMSEYKDYVGKDVFNIINQHIMS